MKTLLILGAGPDQIPGILKAKEMGIYTIVLDGNENASGKDYSDEFYVVSIKHIEQIKSFIETKLSKKVDGVIAFGVDIPYIIAQTAEFLGVNYTIDLECAKLSENKFDSKEFMKENSIAIPSYKLVKSIKDIREFTQVYGFPIVLKPVDNSAARGISFIQDLENIEKYYDYALEFSNQKKVLVEKYLNGPQISTESFVIDGEIYNIGFSDRNYDDMENFLPNIIENGGDLPSLYMKENHKRELKEYLFLIAKKLNIKNGVIKGDIVIYEDELHIIEFALRLSGGNFSTVEIPESTGIDFIKIAIKLHMNMKVTKDELEYKRNDFISLRYRFVDKNHSGIIRSIDNLEYDKNILLSTFHAKVGDRVNSKTTDHSKRLGFALAKGDSREDAILNAQNFLEKVKITFE
ncbi:ATP-grasp domain-containing protein [Arcobacter sp. LA11]|uniref:ATP-grasp domain-containing protein n=1 Tax=Arcobacter sp. LA11 TaxID=1898176 RepID=UPI000934FB5E|nr:ATP-grasp domain-containing protein [Arcobacter sp. LA11]